MVRSTLGHLSIVQEASAVARVAERGSGERLWKRIRHEAEMALASEPVLSRLFFDTVLNQPTLDQALAQRISSRLGNDAVPAGVIADAFHRAMEADHSIGYALRVDLAAVVERDPACVRFIEPLLYFKGFHAIQTHRLAHWLWKHQRRDFALYLQSRSSDVFQTDIHPAARIGKGVFLDHATGLVVGETAVIEDDVSILQDVTLGGTGKEAGDRHPKVRHGAMIGAGAKVLGNIEVGNCARIAAGSVVLQPVPANTTVAGVPARIVGTVDCKEPSRTMHQLLSDASYGAIDYSI